MTLDFRLDLSRQNQSTQLIYCNFKITNELVNQFIVHLPNRLHFRGFCFERMAFQDFVVARCLNIPKLMPLKLPVPEDSKRNDEIRLKIIANPALNNKENKFLEI